MPETPDGRWSAQNGPAVGEGADSGRIPVVAAGLGLSLFLAITYVLCVTYGLLFPKLPMYPAWAPFLPGFEWLTWPSFSLGLLEAFAYGWYVALILVPLYNFFIGRFR